MQTIMLGEFLRELPVPLGFKDLPVTEGKMLKIIKLLNIKDRAGQVYFPEVMYSVCFNFSGTNSIRVEKSFQMHYYLTKLKNTFKGLGKDANWGNLYGTNNLHARYQSKDSTKQGIRV